MFFVLLVFSFAFLPILCASEAKFYTSGNVNFSVAADWEEAPVSSSMRQFQFRIPKAQEDPEDGELAVFYFGPGQGGSVEANLERWQSQFRPNEPLSSGRQSSGPAPVAQGKPAGSSVEVGSEISVKNINGLKVTVTSLEGSYEGAMGMQGGSVKEGYALLGAIVEGPEGLVFFKMTGPRKTVQGARGQFDALLQSFKV